MNGPHRISALLRIASRTPRAGVVAVRLRALVLGAAVAGLVAACGGLPPRFHGYAPDDAALSQIVVGRDNRDSVAELVGRPGTTGLLRDSSWFYVQSRWEQFAWQAPAEVEREVVAISFDQRGVVSNIERFGLENGQVVALSRRVTDTTIADVTLLQQIMRNVGRIDPVRALGG